MQYRILRRNGFTVVWSLLHSLHPHIFTSSAFLTELQSNGSLQRLSQEDIPWGVYSDKCIIHKLDLIIQNLQDNHTPWGNFFHKPKWLYLKEWCGRKEWTVYELVEGGGIASLHLGRPQRNVFWALPPVLVFSKTLFLFREHSWQFWREEGMMN